MSLRLKNTLRANKRIACYSKMLLRAVVSRPMLMLLQARPWGTKRPLQTLRIIYLTIHTPGMPKQIFHSFVDSAGVKTSFPACSVLAWPALPCLAARHAPSWLCYDLSSVNVAARLTVRLPTYLPPACPLAPKRHPGCAKGYSTDLWLLHYSGDRLKEK